MADVAGILNPLGGVVGAVMSGLDSLITSDEERLRAAIDMRKLDLDEQRIDLEGYRVDADLLKGQQAINQVEAQHASIFVAGGRPAAMWVCVAGLAYQFLAHPMLLWSWALIQSLGWIPQGYAPPPPIDTVSLMTLLSGMLGLGAYRTYERKIGKSRDTIKEIIK